ncbi:threonine--tRNA ligase, mitochondrial 1-like [Impatiens glandulifera]|uniref:threonine--tRNA ligase, mitochondrial 1-like n=1 Tax=Impatiens glandulifera TaxID=253017 RepID=UPI001FB0B2D9|nr:threonine--tRNA ligase, mitochondrial 1-like [Impatiens glandulifera]
MFPISFEEEPTKTTSFSFKTCSSIPKTYKFQGFPPLDIAKEISKSLASNALISKVHEVLWDMTRPLVEDCELKLFIFDSDESRDTFWNSSAHISRLLSYSVRYVFSWMIKMVSSYSVWQALEVKYGCQLCIEPCTTRGEGFFYDAYYGDLGLNEEHFKGIEARAATAASVLLYIAQLLYESQMPV